MKQQALEIALDELAEDARDYLAKLERFRATPPGTEVYEDAEVDLEVAVTMLMAHSQSANDLIGELDEEEQPSQA